MLQRDKWFIKVAFYAKKKLKTFSRYNIHSYMTEKNKKIKIIKWWKR